MIRKIKNLINYFKPVNEQYEEDLKEVLNLIVKNKNLKNLDNIIILHKRSKLFMLEYTSFKSNMDYGLNFFESWCKSFTDPIMSYIMKYTDIYCLLHYVNKKRRFWELFCKQNTYSMLLFLLTIIVYKFLQSLFHYEYNLFLIYFCTLVGGFLIFIYFIILISVVQLYKYYCNTHIFIKYFEQKISLHELLQLKKNLNIDKIISQIKNNKLHKQELLFGNLQFYWKILFLIPIICNFIITLLCMGFFMILIWQIFYLSITHIDIMI